MKILHVLTYYRPHTSGLTIYVERLAKAQSERGHQVTVLTSQFSSDLPLSQDNGGVRVLRVPVLLRLSKGVVMPSFGSMAARLVKGTQVVHLHLPQLDAAGVALKARRAGRPSVITYHCDLQLPPGLLNRGVNLGVHLMNHLAARLTDRVVTYTQDYADSSRFLRRYAHKTRIISPPVVLPTCSEQQQQALAERCGCNRCTPVIGMATRFAAEKGVEVLLGALPEVLRRFPRAKVLFAGQYRQVLGEREYWRRLEPELERLQAEGRWEFLGVLDPQEMAAYYRCLDLLVVPSLNATESFGLVQIEAMMNGVPVVASNLPGVRQPVQLTGMGRTAEVGSPESLALEIEEVLSHRDQYRGDAEAVAHTFAPANAAARYEELYLEVLGQRQRLERDG